MNDRKPLSKKTRFEVFKRDKFTCQYCGKSAPDVVLEVDHIIPIAEGGDNDLMNLVTACFDCNRGKGARELSDDAVLKKQKAQLDLLQERREQIEMMCEWQLGLADETKMKVGKIGELIDGLTGYGVTNHGEEEIRDLIGKFGFPVVAKATRLAFERYPHSKEDDWEYAFSKIGGISYNLTHKTCGQCIHNDGYNQYRHMVKCEYDHDGGYWCKNSYAEVCDYYESYWNRGDSNA